MNPKSSREERGSVGSPDVVSSVIKSTVASASLCLSMKSVCAWIVLREAAARFASSHYDQRVLQQSCGQRGGAYVHE